MLLFGRDPLRLVLCLLQIIYKISLVKPFGPGDQFVKFFNFRFDFKIRYR